MYCLIVLLVITQAVFSQGSKGIEVTFKRKSDKSVAFYYQKNLPGSYVLKINFSDLENCDDNSTYTKVVKNSAGSLFTLKPTDKNVGISFSYGVTYIQGNPKPKVKDNISYLLPFKKGEVVKVTEAANLGEKYFGDDKPTDWKSFIVLADNPATILAMRKGIVVRIIDKYDEVDEFNTLFTTNRNSIVIEHKDGTYASYKGFKKNNIVVKLGQKVYPHTVLGKLSRSNKASYRFDFNVYHFTENIIDTERKSVLTNKNKAHKTKFLNPSFYTGNKIQKLRHGSFYEVSYSDEVKLEEFSKREIKKFKKNPKEFQ